VDALKAMKMEYPRATAEKKRELAAVRKELDKQ